MLKQLLAPTCLLVTFLTLLGIGILAARAMLPEPSAGRPPLAVIVQENPTETIPPYTPLPSLTPSSTLKPPPTFEPATPTSQATHTPTVTPTATLQLDVSIPNLNGAETPTPTSTAGCQPRQDWKLTYTVQFDDALSGIALKYNTSVDEMVAANCITNKNLIAIGQVLRVPGASQPVSGGVDCIAYEVQTPMNGTMAVEGDLTMTFNWRGPVAPRNLIRIIRPDGSTYERMVELRQNDTINTSEFLRDSGWYMWYVYPLDNNFQQINCKEGGPWTFSKGPAATYTPSPTPSNTPDPSLTGGNTTGGTGGTGASAPVAAFSMDTNNGAVPLTVNFINQSTGQLNSFVWDFGDGQFSSASSPTHVYNSTGIYTVTLTVYGVGGSSTTAAIVTVN